MMTNNSEFMIGETKYQVAKKLFGSYVVESKDETIDFITYLETLDNFDLKYEDRVIKVEMSKFSISDFPQLVIDENNIIQGIEVGMQRKLENKIKGTLRSFSNQILEQFQAFAEDCKNNKFTAKELSSLRIDVPKINFDAINYGEFIHELNLEVVQQFRNILEDDFQPIVKELSAKVDGGSQLSKSEKTVRKFIQNYEKTVESILEDYTKKVQDRINDVMKLVRNNSKLIRKTLNITNDDIFFFDMSKPMLVATPSEIEPTVLDFIQNNNDIDYDGFSEETLRSNLSVKLFDSISNSTLERSFDQIIQNKMDNRIKKLRNESKNVVEFESNLRDQGRVQAYDLFDDLHKIVERCTDFYIRKDGVVTIDSNVIKLHLGRLALAKYRKRELITDLIKSPDLNVERDGDSWLISYGFNKAQSSNVGIPNVITFRDTAHYIHKLELMEELKDILLAIQDVGRLIEQETYNRIEEMKLEMFGVIYDEQ